MRHQQQRHAVRTHLGDALQALVLERLVADREDLVREQDVGLHVDGDREAEAHVHPRRVVLDRRVDERLELREPHDAVVASPRVAVREAEQARVQVDVLGAGQIGMEADAELDQRRDAAVRRDRARRRPQDAGDDLQQRALARAVGPEQRDGLAARDRQRHAVERAERFAMRTPARVEDADQPRLQVPHAVVQDREVLRHVVEADHRPPGDTHARGSSDHSRSTRRCAWRQ